MIVSREYLESLPDGRDPDAQVESFANGTMTRSSSPPGDGPRATGDGTAGFFGDALHLIQEQSLLLPPVQGQALLLEADEARRKLHR